MPYTRQRLYHLRMTMRQTITAAVATSVLALMLLTPPIVSGQVEYQLGARGQWVQQEAPPPNSPAGRIQTIRKLIAEDRGGDAEDMADQWIQRYPANHLLAEAYLLRGDAKLAQGGYYDSLYDYERVLRQFAGSPQFDTALRREYEIARLFAHGFKHKFLGLRILPSYEEAEELFIRIQERAPGSTIGEKASLALGDFYFDTGDMQSAATSYELFLKNYPQSLHKEEAMLRLIQADLAAFKGPKFDGTALLEAAERLRLYQKAFPAAADKIGASSLLARINESLARKVFFTADYYQQRNQKVSAVYMYQRLVHDYPQTAAAQDAIGRLNELHAPVMLTAQKLVPVDSQVNTVQLPKAATSQPAGGKGGRR